MRTQTEIQQWLVNKVCEELEMTTSEVDVNVPLAEYGVDSITIVQFTSELEKWLDITLDPTALYNHPTIEAISAFVVDKQKA